MTDKMLGIRLHHFVKSSDWEDVQKIAEDILRLQTEGILDEEDEVIRDKMINEGIAAKKFWKKFRTKIINTVKKPEKEEIVNV